MREITDKQELIVACPYCDKEAVVKLKPYVREKKILRRDAEETEQSLGFDYEFPEILPTEEPKETTN